MTDLIKFETAYTFYSFLEGMGGNMLTVNANQGILYQYHVYTKVNSSETVMTLSKVFRKNELYTSV